tara:strand:- start:325 stop:2442 length:2118 start_codon:yes stop_codon:yes gene_type:complete
MTSLLSSINTKKKYSTLDLSDELRSMFHNNIIDEQIRDQVMAEIATFVILGPQSAGKSSVIRRLSGIAFPEKATRCTRVATTLKLRKENTKRLEVILKCPDGKEIPFYVVEISDICEAVQRAQNRAIDESGSNDFANNHEIIVIRSDPNQPNMTLIDLPGFTNESDNASNKVLQMASRHLQNKDSLALHVIRADQDYDSMLGNDFIRHKIQNKVTILTHCDRINNDPDLLERWSETICKAGDHVFAIDGRHIGNTTDEYNKLMTCSAVAQAAKTNNINIGTATLTTYLEDCTIKHLKKQIPRIHKVLQKVKGDTQEQLSKVREVFLPIDILNDTLNSIRKYVQVEGKLLENRFRNILTETHLNILNFRICTHMASDFIGEKIDKFDVAAMEIGTKVIVHSHHDKSSLIPISRIHKMKLNGQEITRAYYCTDDGEEKEATYWVKDDQTNIWNLEKNPLVSRNQTSRLALIKDIKIMAERERGLRNLLHIDRQKILDAHVQAFAEYYGTALKQACARMYEELAYFYRNVFEIQHSTIFVTNIVTSNDSTSRISPVARKAANLMWEDMNSALKDIRLEAEKTIEDMVAHNTIPELIWTSNEYALDQLISDMIADDPEPSDDGGASHIYHNIRAFLQVQKRSIAEIACKQLVLKLYCNSKKKFETILADSTLRCLEQIKEPERTANERLRLQQQRQLIEAAIGLVKMQL